VNDGFLPDHDALDPTRHLAPYDRVDGDAAPECRRLTHERDVERLADGGHTAEVLCYFDQGHDFGQHAHDVAVVVDLEGFDVEGAEDRMVVREELGWDLACVEFGEGAPAADDTGVVVEFLSKREC